MTENQNTQQSITEEQITIQTYGDKISKNLNVFYNPIMKINRDISLLFIKTYFTTINKKQIKFCDPMTASGIRELRFLKTIPEIFEKITMGDISQQAIENIKNNFKLNKISLDKCELNRTDAINTISKQYYDFIEIDPFGSPVPFLDTAIQRIKHNGILSVTATDTAALCGTYPNRTLRKYGIKVEKTLCYEEIGLRNLIAHCQIQAAKYDKTLTPQISFSHNHFYKIFFIAQESKKNSTKHIKNLRYLEYNKQTQQITQNQHETKNSTIGKTYTGPLNNKQLLNEMINNLNLIQDKKKIEKLLTSLNEEINQLGHYNIHKLEKTNNISTTLKFQQIIEKLQKQGYQASKPHCNRLSIKTNAKPEQIVEILKLQLQKK